MKKIMKVLLLAVAVTAISQSASAAPGAPFRKGAFYPGVAAGLGSGLGYLGGIALIANAEYGVTDNIGIGGSIGYWSYSEDIAGYGSTIKYKYSIIPIVASGAYHFNVGVANLDLGAGVSLGYYIVNSSVESSVAGVTYASAGASGIALGVFGVARYFVAENLALRAKLGYGITVAEVGIDFRF